MLGQEARFVAEEIHRTHLQVALSMAGESAEMRRYAAEKAKALTELLVPTGRAASNAATVDDVAKYKEQYFETFGIDVDNPEHMQELERRIAAKREARRAKRQAAVDAEKRKRSVFENKRRRRYKGR